MRSASQTIHYVGDSDMGWNVTSNLSIWASSNKFYVNDSIAFGYDPEKHDVIVVSCESDYAEGRIDRYYYHSEEFEDQGHTLIPLYETGPWYFICGKCSAHKFTIQVEPHPQDNISKQDKEETEDNKP